MGLSNGVFGGAEADRDWDVGRFSHAKDVYGHGLETGWLASFVMANDRFDFEDLKVFQKSLDLVEAADEFARHFRGHRKRLGFHLFDAANSVALNIGESTGKESRLDRARFLDIGNGSARETGAAVCIADRLDIGPADLRRRLRRLLVEIISMLTTNARLLRERARRR